MMNGSKPCRPSGGPQAPSPKRRWSRLRASCSPSPRPSPPGEGETFVRALKIRTSLVVVCVRYERQRSGACNGNVRIFQRRASALPLPAVEGSGEGERSKLQPQAHDDSWNCQISRSPAEPGVCQFGYENCCISFRFLREPSYLGSATFSARDASPVGGGFWLPGAGGNARRNSARSDRERANRRSSQRPPAKPEA